MSEPLDDWIYLNIYIYICVYVCTCLTTWKFKCTRICAYGCVYVFVYVFYIYIYIYIYSYVYVFESVSICMFPYSQAFHTHTQACAHKARTESVVSRGFLLNNLLSLVRRDWLASWQLCPRSLSKEFIAWASFHTYTYELCRGAASRRHCAVAVVCASGASCKKKL